jgi:hypothetical protein
MEGDDDFFRLANEPYVSQVTVGLDMSHAVAGVARNLAGRFSITASWLPAETRDALRGMIGAGRQTSTLRHPDLPDGSATLRLEVMRLAPADDTTQLDDGDPVGGCRIFLVSHGEPDA